MRDIGVEIVEVRLARTAAGDSRERLLESPPQTVFRIFIRTGPWCGRAAADCRSPNAVGVVDNAPGRSHDVAGPCRGVAVSVTIHDVARRANVSISTVSRAFTSPDLVRQQTRTRV